jgi:hypothetical protein
MAHWALAGRPQYVIAVEWITQILIHYPSRRQCRLNSQHRADAGLQLARDPAHACFLSQRSLDGFVLACVAVLDRRAPQRDTAVGFALVTGA